MAQPSSESVQAELQHTPRRLLEECPWCNASAGRESSSGSTSRLCNLHRRDLRNQIHARRERRERFRELLD